MDTVEQFVNPTAEQHVYALLSSIVGEDADRKGLLETPDRVVRALHEMTSGYGEDPAEILSKQFDESCDEMVVLRNVRFVSLCEHHMLPFQGTASVGYIPVAKVVGLSKLARLVECYARRLQVQERLTTQIANAIQEHLQPLGAGVVIKAHHGCMGCRGVMQPSSEMVTSALLGAMRDTAVRTEFLSLANP